MSKQTEEWLVQVVEPEECAEFGGSRERREELAEFAKQGELWVLYVGIISRNPCAWCSKKLTSCAERKAKYRNRVVFSIQLREGNLGDRRIRLGCI